MGQTEDSESLIIDGVNVSEYDSEELLDGDDVESMIAEET